MKSLETVPYGRIVKTSLGFEQAIEAARAALKAEGFGVLGEIDVTKTIREKIGAEFRPYRILGACNPQLAHRALERESQLGLLLPCNIVVQVQDGKTVVSTVDATALLSLVGNSDLRPVAEQVNSRLARVLDAVAGVDGGSPSLHRP